jgi:Nucleotidyltransferase of unknown function (DUF6036)
MATIESEQVLAFLKEVGKRYPSFAKLILVGGGALCVLGSPRPTLDIDYIGNDLQKDNLQIVMDEVANEMGFDVDAVPVPGVIPLLPGGQKRNILVGNFGKIEVSIIDPYAIALSKLDRGLIRISKTLSFSSSVD